jgi:proton-coupled amino acid transporter
MGFVGTAPAGGSGSFSTVMNLIKPFVGVGVLALPKVWGEGGILLASLFLLVLAYIATWAIFRLVECADVLMLAEARRNARQRLAAEQAAENPVPATAVRAGAPTYASNDDNFSDAVQVPFFDPEGDFDDALITEHDRASVSLPTFTEIGKAAYGTFGGLIVDVSILVTQVGACIAYIVFMSKNFSDVIGLPSAVWVGILFLPLALLSTIRRMDQLAPASTMGNVVYIFTIAVIMTQGFRLSCCLNKDEVHYADFSTLPLIFGTASFALEGIALILPVKNRMKAPGDFRSLMIWSMIVVTTLYLGFSIFGYLFFGNSVASPIINSLPDDALTDTVKISLSIAIFFTFVLQTFPASTFFDELIDAKLGVNMAELKAVRIRERAQEAAAAGAPLPTAADNHDLDNPEVLIPHLAGRRHALQNVARFLFVAFVCVVGIIFPDFKLIVSLFGSLSNAMLAYVFPALFWLRICLNTPLYGYLYFPFTRGAERLQDPRREHDTALLDDEQQRQGDSESGRAIGKGAVNSSGSARTRERSSSSIADESGIKTPSLGTRFCWTWFPLTVGIVGILASIIGVTDAIRDIVHEFGK